MNVLPKGVRHVPMALTIDAQRDLLAAIRSVVSAAPLYVPTMPRTGKPMRVQMSNCGVLGWVTDKERGYRYQSTHPVTGQPWPAIPDMLHDLWDTYAAYKHKPEACLINYYEPSAKMGLHQDRDEEDFDAPVVSVSLGDTCLFRVGENSRSGRTTSLKLQSGDVLVMGGEGRLSFHGVDRIYPDTSALLKKAGRINLTLRRVTKP
ncbi:MAG: alpha-ketoglutarate-dependent dioxygenase AlkB [Pseudomonadota bacterium]